jgi:MoaA/NifB/PqqE/SkfB family radical SAM enzyme
VSGFLEFPTVFYIEPTNDCNLSCIMCPRKKSRKAVGYMSFGLFRDVVDQLSRRNIAQLSLHLAGEPLLHPRIAEMVAYAKGSGLRTVRFATNATLLNENLA